MGKPERVETNSLGEESTVNKKTFAGSIFCGLLTALLMAVSSTAFADGMQVVSEKTATGFAFPESVAYDPQAKVLYVSQFGSELKPTQMDGKGRISRVSLSGEILDAQFLPPQGTVLNKPKGIWVDGNRLWVTDIDSVWVFDIASRKGRKLELPGIKFANDPTVIGNALYVSDNRGDQLYRVEPADFLNVAGEPGVSVVFSGKDVNPNGVYPAKDGSLLLVGFKSKDEPRGIFSLRKGGDPKLQSDAIGRLDGVYELDDGSLLVTDWDSGSLGHWSAMKGYQPLATGFKGPADFAVVPNSEGLLVVVPDLVKSELRLVQLSK
jgi:DNA-binding beta-propeller fold protein YncE